MPAPFRILIVEDCAVDAEAIERELRAAGIELVAQRVERAAEFERAVDSAAWDLVLCDFSLPDFGPAAALDLLRARGIDLPLIVVTPGTDEESATEFLRRGAHDWVAKTKLSRLGPSVRRALEDAASRQTARRASQQQKMEALGRLAAGVAHDVNNMLTATTGFSQLLLMKMSAADPLKKYAEQILKACDHAAQLTRQLLTFSRKQVVAPEVLDLNAVLQQAEFLLRRLIGEDIRLAIHSASPIGAVRIDRGQFDQVIMNLAAHARDAMPRGGTLTIETAEFVLDETEARMRLNAKPGPYVQLSFADTGIGMDAAARARIFEPFFTPTEGGKSTGLGLATVGSIIEHSGGHIEVVSEVGSGSRFEICLPRVAAAPPVARNLETQSADISGGTETILLAEDEEMVRELIRSVLDSNGYTVVQAGSGDEALEIIRRAPRRVDLLLTDVVMPGMNGYELAHRFEVLQPKAKVLYMSGHTESAILRHGVEAGDLHFLQKPFSPVILAQKVRAVLDQL